MIFLLTLLSAWPVDWYQEYSQLNWDNMERVSSRYGDSAVDLAVKAISQFGNGTGDPLRTAGEAVALDSTDYRTWTALAFVGMRQDSTIMDSLFSKAFRLAIGTDAVLSEAYSYWLLSTGNSAEAVIHSNASLGADSSFGPAWLTLSMALIDEGRTGDALVVSEEGVRRLPDCIPLLYQYGQALEESGDALRAIAVYREVIQQDPARVPTYSSLGLLLEGIKMNGEAIKVYREVLQIRPEYGWAWSKLASCMLDQGRPDLADSFFQCSLEFSPDNPWSLFQLAKLRLNTDPIYARELLEQAVLLDSNYLQAWQELAFLYESEENFPGAESALRKCIELDPEPWLYGELGWVLESRGMYSEAAEVYETSISIDPQYLYGWQRRGDLFNIGGESHTAAEWYSEALFVLENGDPWIWGELGSMAVAELLIDSAEHCFSRALELDQEYSSMWLDLARVQRIIGEPDEALSSLDQYLLLSGDSGVVAAERILLLETKGENTDSLSEEISNTWQDAWISAGWSAYDGHYISLSHDFADRAFLFLPDTPWEIINLGELYRVLERYWDRKLCYELAAGLETDDYQVAVSIADYYYEEEMIEQAIELLANAYDFYPWNEILTTSLAEAHLFDDQLTRAEELLLQVVERNPASVYAICYLGLIEENRGNPEGALDRYLEALRIEPGYSYAESRLRYISGEDYDPGLKRRSFSPFSWNLWIDLSSTGGNIDEQYYGGGGSISRSFGRMGSSVSFETSARSEIKDGKDIRRTAWASLSAEHFLTDHLYAGASSSWDRQPITVRPWQVSSYLAAGWKSWPASWIWIAPETGAGLVNTKWSTDQGRTDELTAYASLSTWASSVVSWFPSLWLSGSIYLPPKDMTKIVANAVGELEFDLPGRISLVFGTSLDYTRTPVVESWKKLDSEMYLRLRF
ncbi:MAG: tetratricopeptide repeat protein [Candidatus Sabulitectum sp.]|nr:tetratricopeptide repeat protein [Candidatus Sabulitectum sp.]